MGNIEKEVDFDLLEISSIKIEKDNSSSGDFASMPPIEKEEYNSPTDWSPSASCVNEENSFLTSSEPSVDISEMGIGVTIKIEKDDPSSASGVTPEKENISQTVAGTVPENHLEASAESSNLGENASIKNEAVEEDIFEFYKRWDPMKVHYNDPMNISNMDSSAPGAAFLRENAPAVSTELKDIPCKFHDGVSQHCWKGYCPYYHPIYGSKDFDVVTQQKVRRFGISHFFQLEEKNMACNGAIMEVTVEYVKNPGKFYVTSDASDFECLCAMKKKNAEFPDGKGTRQQLEAQLTEELSNGLKYMNIRFSDYTEFQLVAVKRCVNGKSVFCRGVVMKTTGDIDEFENPAIPVQLLDTGQKLCVKFNELCHLPSKYVAMFPTLAYQCCLHGISSVTPVWTTEATNYFKELVLGKKCILEVKRTPQVPSESPIRLFEEDNPYQVELRIPMPDPVTGEERYQSVAHILSQHFHGILWNVAPFRPFLLKKHPTQETFSLFCSGVYFPQDLDLTYKIEKKRMAKWAKCNI